MNRSTPALTEDFFDVLRQREAQARDFGARHLAVVPDTDSMLFWLARAAKQARTELKRKQVHIAASAGEGVDQSTIARFEKHVAWPDRFDDILGGYEDDLDIEQFDLWAAALKMWREYRALSPSERAAWEAEQTAARTRGRRPADGKAARAPRRGSPGR